jgi:TPR repeat protein
MPAESAPAFVGGDVVVRCGDHQQAVSWVRKAAETGDAPGMCYLGYLYEHGQGGVQKDYQQALSWYRKAAKAGNADGKC